MNKVSWIEKLKVRWKLKSAWHAVIVLLVFACTGFTVLFIKKPLLTWLAGEGGDTTLASVLYYIFILPLYNVILLGYGFVFGQFHFFYNFEKRIMERFFTFFKREN